MWEAHAATTSNPSLGGDLSGAASSGTVVKLRGIALSATVPTSGQIMKFDGAQWAPATPPTFNPTFLGDVTGTVSAMVVAKLQGYQISNAQPADGQVLKYNAVGSQWLPQSPSVPWTAVTGKPTAVSAFSNDSGYLTGASSLAWGKVTGAPAFITTVPAQDWSTITSKPTIPVNTSQLTNNSGFLTSITGSGASITSGTVPLAALASGALNQQLVYNGSAWAAKDDIHEFAYVIQDTANDLTTTTGSVASVLTNAMPTGWTIQSVYCQADSGSPTFNIQIAGTNLFSSAQTCTTTNQAFTSFASASMASAAVLSHNTIAAATGNVSITIKYKQL